MSLRIFTKYSQVIRTHGLGSDTYELELTVPVIDSQSALEHSSDPSQIEPLTALLSATVLPLLKEAQSSISRLLTSLKEVPDGNFKTSAVNRSIALRQRLTGVKTKLVECGVVQERRIEEKVSAAQSGAETHCITTNNVASVQSSSKVNTQSASRKRKSTGKDSKWSKRRKKTQWESNVNKYGRYNDYKLIMYKC